MKILQRHSPALSQIGQSTGCRSSKSSSTIAREFFTFSLLVTNTVPVGGGRLAGWHELGLHRDLARLVVLLARLDQAHPAARHHRQARMPAVMTESRSPTRSRRLNAVQALLLADGDFVSVNDDCGHVHVSQGSKLIAGRR